MDHYRLVSLLVQQSWIERVELDQRLLGLGLGLRVMGYGDEVPPGRCISYTFFHFCNYVPAGLSPVPFGTPASTSTQCNALIMPYKLSQVLQAHDADVKCVLAIDEHTLFSASRDRTVAQWARQSQVGEHIPVLRLGQLIIRHRSATRSLCEEF